MSWNDTKVIDTVATYPTACVNAALVKQVGDRFRGQLLVGASFVDTTDAPVDSVHEAKWSTGFPPDGSTWREMYTRRAELASGAVTETTRRRIRNLTASMKKHPDHPGGD